MKFIVWRVFRGAFLRARGVGSQDPIDVGPADGAPILLRFGRIDQGKTGEILFCKLFVHVMFLFKSGRDDCSSRGGVTSIPAQRSGTRHAFDEGIGHVRREPSEHRRESRSGNRCSRGRDAYLGADLAASHSSLSPRLQAEAERPAAMPDEQIDLSDIGVTGRGKFYRPIKRLLTLPPRRRCGSLIQGSREGSWS